MEIPVWYRRSICDLLHGMHRAAGAFPHFARTGDIERLLFSAEVLPAIVAAFNHRLTGASEAAGNASVGKALYGAFAELEYYISQSIEPGTALEQDDRPPLNDYRDDIERFAELVVREEVSKGAASHLCEYYAVSEMHALFTLFMNRASLNHSGQIQNFDACRERVWEKLKEWFVEDYQPSPPFEDWECEYL